MYCKECGTEVQDGPFCSGCGVALKQPTKLGNKIKDRDNFRETPIVQNTPQRKKNSSMSDKDKVMLIPRILAGGLGLIFLIAIAIFIWVIISLIFAVMMMAILGSADWVFYLSFILGALATVGILEYWMRGG